MKLIHGLREIYTPLGQGPVYGTPKIQTIADGALAVNEDGQIVELGSARELARSYPDAESIDMGGRVAIPCFVDPHTHLVWGGDRSGEFNRRLYGATYTEIAAAGGGIKSTVRQTRAATEDELVAKGMHTLDTMLKHGVATIEAKTGYGLNLETETKQLDVMDRLQQVHPVEIRQTFMGAHELPPEFTDHAAYVGYLNHEVLPLIRQRGTVDYVDIFCEKGVFELDTARQHLAAAAELGFALRVHADELFPLGGAGLAAEFGAATADHLVHSRPEHMRAMAEAGTMAVLLPGTSFFLRGPYADARTFIEQGCAVALSTDYNPGSSHTVSQALIMALACMNMGLTFEESFLGVTLNAAASLGLASRLGSLEPGKQADIAFLDVPSAMYLVYYWGINHVSDVMKQGRFVVRDRHVLT